MTAAPAPVGVVGLGLMGRPMATDLVRAGTPAAPARLPVLRQLGLDRCQVP